MIPDFSAKHKERRMMASRVGTLLAISRKLAEYTMQANALLREARALRTIVERELGGR